MAQLSPEAARAFWKALLDNASRLIADAQLLLNAGSPGRARSLSVLAMEELGKAVWVYDSFFIEWNSGSQTPREVSELARSSTNHLRKYMAAFVFGDELAEFWGDYSRVLDLPQNEAEFEVWHAALEKESDIAARAANAQKQQGFYADLGALPNNPPSSAEVQEELTRSAQVIEMMLIKDHSRMKFDSKLPYDSTHEQQWRLMPTAHPDEYQSFIESRTPEKRDKA